MARSFSTSRLGPVVVLAALVAALPATPAGAQATPAASRLVAVAPERLLDTREAGGPFAPGDVREVVVAGRSGAPADVTAAVVTLTATDIRTAGFVTAWPSGAAVPGTSNLNLEPGDTRASTAVVPLGPGGAFSLRSTAAANLVVDLQGWFAPSGETAEGRIVPVAPARVLDTRIGLGWPADPAPDTTITLPLAGVGGVPALGEAGAVWLSLTSADAVRSGWVAARPTGASGALTSNLNNRPGGVRAVLVLVPLGPDGAVQLVSQAGGPLVADVVAYVTGPAAPTTDAGLFVPLSSPLRLLDTRDGAAGATRLAGGQPVLVRAAGRAGIPANAAGVLGTLTQVLPSRPGYVSAWPDGVAEPATSNVNAERRRGVVAAALLTGLGAGAFTLRANVSTDLVVDLAGWLTPGGALDPAEATGPVAVPGAAPGPVEPAEDPWEDQFPQSRVSVPGWAAPPVPGASGSGRRVVFQGSTQRVWAVDDDGRVLRSWRVSGSRVPGSNEVYGTYRVFQRQVSTIGLGGHVSMRWFVGYRGTPNGNTIGFHEIPRSLGSGLPIMEEGQLGVRASAGCQRMATLDAQFLWAFAPLGTLVVVVP